MPSQTGIHVALPSDIDVPGADNSSMDGYGYAAADLAKEGGALKIVGESLAGHPYGDALGAGECVRIMTGAVVPAGVDTVGMQENTHAEGDRLVVEQRPKPGSNIRAAGEDIAAGATVLTAGDIVQVGRRRMVRIVVSKKS